jgi:two-component system, OmpR family, sensor histidine kinase ChvG
MGSATAPSEPAGPPAAWRRWLGRLYRIRYRLLLVNAVVVAVPLVGITFARMHEQQMLDGLEADMIHQAQLLREVLSADPDGVALEARQPMLVRAARQTRTRIRLLDTGGVVRADSHAGGPPEGAEPPLPRLGGGWEPSHAAEPPRAVELAARREIRIALAGHYGAATRFWENQERLYLFSALPVWVGRGADRHVAAVVYVTRSTQTVKLALFRLRRWLFEILAAAVAASAVLSLFLAATIARPLGQLTRIAERIASGDRTARPAAALRRGDEIGQLARAVDRMARGLDARAGDLRDLAADLSHELKAPLTGIRGAAELLRDGAADDAAARARFLAIIEADAARLDRLVMRLLELSRADSDASAPEPVDYRAAIAAAAARCRRGAAIAVEYPEGVPGLVEGRPHLLAAALDNLIDNAACFAAPGSAVTVRVGDGGGGLLTEVHNDGPPIAAAARPRLFTRFFTTRAGSGGSGLGLAIVAAAVAHHGGAVGVDSSAAAGTTFWFTLPRAPSG